MTFKVSEPSAKHLRGLWSELGAVLTGRRTFDVAHGWNGHHGWPVATFLHRGRPPVLVLALSLLIGAAPPVAAQEGRPALKAETAEDARVLRVIRDSLPHQWAGWTVDRESDTGGARRFHDSGEAVRYPFHHEYKIDYSIDLQSAQAAALRQALDRGQRSPEEIDSASHISVVVSVNNFEVSGRSGAAIERRALAPFDVALWGARGAQLLLGPWTVTRNERTGEGYEYAARATRDMTTSMGQIQAIAVQVIAPPDVREAWLREVDLTALRGLLGSSSLQQRAMTGTAVPVEKPLATRAPGANVFRFEVAGPGFASQTVSIKPSDANQQAYLRNDHPDPRITENAVTRLLVQEDSDPATRTPYPFADMTLPFVRRTGDFVVTKDGAEGAAATFTAAVACWSGCEWSFNADRIEISVTRYDPVGGFIEGTFHGTAIAVYRANQPIDDHRNLPVTISNGSFKIRRKADRY